MTTHDDLTGSAASRVPAFLSPRHWRKLLALLLMVVFTLAVMPAPPREVDTGWDKLNHLLAFATLAFAGMFAEGQLTAPRRARWGGWPTVCAGLLAFGGLIEIVQAMVPGRSCEFADLMADAVGIVAGAGLAWGVGRLILSPPVR